MITLDKYIHTVTLSRLLEACVATHKMPYIITIELYLYTWVDLNSKYLVFLPSFGKF
jgi:hypothetical protein